MDDRHASTSVSWKFVNWRLFRYRFVVLLWTVTLLLVATPILHAVGMASSPTLVRAIMAGLFGITLLAAVFSVADRPKPQIVAVLLGVPAIVLQVVNVLLERKGIVVPTHMFSIVFLGYTVSVLLGYLFSADRVNANTICVSLCVYLLLGVLWAVVYSLLAIMEPTSFSMAMGPPDVFMRFGDEHSVNPLGYSFATMTTLGHGDIAPASPVSHMFATLEAVVGQLYLVVLVARFVSLHILQSSNRSA